MGIASSLKPKRLPEKLIQIRAALDLSQNEMVGRLGFSEDLTREELSAFERGLRQPPLLVLLRYARCAGVSTDLLIDDETDLPPSIKKAAKAGVIRHKSGPRARRER
jgi:transcriptional regulator with XRE-family HTH domain